MREPENSDIRKVVMRNAIIFRIPGNPHSKAAHSQLTFSGFMVFFFGLGTVLMWSGGTFSEGMSWIKYFFPGVCLIATGIALGDVQRMFGETILKLTPDWIILRYELWGGRYSRRVETRLITHCLITTWDRQRPSGWRSAEILIKGLTLRAGRKHVNFGSQLTDTEQTWLCEEIRAYLAEYRRARQ